MAETKKRGRPKNPQYHKIKDLPVHIFKNRQCTDPVGEDFKEYLRYMLDNHPDDLHYIFRHSQLFVNYGGSFRMTYLQWRDRLKKKLKKDEI